jgi:hypothetical protein
MKPNLRTIVARIPRHPSPEERARSGSSWPVTELCASAEDVDAHRRWWGTHLPSNVVLSVTEIPEDVRDVYEAFKSLLASMQEGR